MSRLPVVVHRWGTTLAVAVIVSACGGGDSEPTLEQEAATLSIQVTSLAFTEGASIPVTHTCDGEDTSPPLSWAGVPTDTKSIALISDDPDAPGGTWVHWVYYAIPADVGELQEAIATADELPDGARQGKNDFKRVGYGGPCPPKGGPHRYFFKVYALDVEIELGPGATKKELLRSMDGHVVAQGQLMGTYKRR